MHSVQLTEHCTIGAFVTLQATEAVAQSSGSKSIASIIEVLEAC